MAAAVLVLVVPVAAACGSDPDAQPTVASVDFDPRLVVTIDGTSATAEATGRTGAVEGGAGGAAWSVPAGSVVEVAMDATEPRRVTISITPSATADDPGTSTPWADAGTMEPDDTTVLALSATGIYRITAEAPDGRTTDIALEVVPRSAS
jgi:hypothetical protein